MIRLDVPYTTTVQYLSGDTVVSATVTDTLYVQEVRLDFTTGALYATIQRGTIVDGQFTQNYPTVQVTVNPDDSFISSDGSWKGSLSGLSTLIDQLKSQFDRFILSSGAVTGTTL